ncbi:MAG: hypothetical protein K0Q87_5028 [Neobacillus sp.]|nr:hypothetical protein [Neobacillus sp.]
MTNFEKIKQMSVDEMAEFLIKFEKENLTGALWNIKRSVTKWLESEVQE